VPVRRLVHHDGGLGGGPQWSTNRNCHASHVKDRVRERYLAQVDGLRALGALVAIMWAVELVNALDSYRLDHDGIVPRNLSHLDGIVFAPFLHASFSHLLGNTIPFLILGFAIALEAGTSRPRITSAGSRSETRATGALASRRPLLTEPGIEFSHPTGSASGPPRPARMRAAWIALLAAACAAIGLLTTSASATKSRAIASAATQSGQEAALLRRDDLGLYVAFCPSGEEAATVASSGSRASAAMASHEGWPEDECLKMDKGLAGYSHTLIGLQHVHNWLLGGYGNDTIYGGGDGDVIWGDFHPSGQPESQRDYLHGGAGADWIYSSHGFNEIWTGAGDDHLALVYGHGIVYCNGTGLKTFVMRYLPQNRPWTLVGCTHKVIDPYRA
jgi:hypothetical protein